MLMEKKETGVECEMQQCTTSPQPGFQKSASLSQCSSVAWLWLLAQSWQMEVNLTNAR